MAFSAEWPWQVTYLPKPHPFISEMESFLYLRGLMRTADNTHKKSITQIWWNIQLGVKGVNNINMSTWMDDQNQKLEGNQWVAEWDGLHSNIYINTLMDTHTEQCHHCSRKVDWNTHWILCERVSTAGLVKTGTLDGKETRINWSAGMDPSWCLLLLCAPEVQEESKTMFSTKPAI